MVKKLFLLCMCLSGAFLQAQTFVHPGILHSQESFNSVCKMVKAGKDPWKSGFERLRSYPQASADYKMKGPFEQISRDPKKGLHKTEVDNDCNAVYYNAIMWTITGDSAHARKAVEILNAYAYTLKAILPLDAELLAGLNGDQFINGAEILRYTYKSWKPEDIAQCEKMFREIFYPVVKDFAEYANGNWGNACIKMVMAVGVFCNDREIFQRGVDYYLHGKGNGSLPNYVINNEGQCQESGRDQQHAQLGIGNLAEAAEIAYNQGVDLYGAYNNRLLKGFEYAARYNLGNDVPFTTFADKTGKYVHQKISAEGRGEFRPIYEMVLNHYRTRKGLDAPYIQKVVDKIRPEDAGSRPYDQPGFGSLLFATLTQSFAQAKKTISVEAPDKQTRIELLVNKQTKLQYRILYSGKEAISWSDLRLSINGCSLGENITLQSGKINQVNEKFAWALGENDTVANKYNEMTVSCVSSGLPFDIQVRVFNGAVAFRYKVTKALTADGNRILGDYTTFHFPKSTTIYQYNQESLFTPVAIDSLAKTCDFPATLRNSGFYYSIGEAENDWYTKAELKKGNEPNTLMVTFPRDTVVMAADQFATPWRTVCISKSAIGLHDYSDLYLKLNTKPVQEIPKWIKPGKLIRSQLNTQSGLDCIDFAVKHNMQYIMFDAGWYGAEFRSTSDPTQVIPAIDMPKVINYGKEKGIGVILYVNYVGLSTKLDTILPLYKQWGVSGLKFGFVDGLTQKGIIWLNQAIRKVNDYGFILDIHDNYKPTGLSRNYPALLTQEGIRGDENSPDAFHTTVLPYTRFLAGPADFTFCYPNSKETFSKNLKVTKAHQLALSVVYFSPLQSLYWYGKPLDYTNDEETEFFDRVPTVWNESRYLAGEIGENICVARRNGEVWFLGSVAGLKDWNSNVSLSFLKPGVIYEATVYEDDGTGSLRKSIQTVKTGTVFSLSIKAKGGQAVIIHPVNK